MRKICLLTFSLLIFLSATHLVLDLLNFGVVSATSNVAVAQEISPTPAQQVIYELPYPGLLPDNPLYFLKVIRDKIVSFLISDPLRKAEFNLLQADKRLNAGIYLFNKGKTSLALSTVSKAENYLEEALGKMKDARMEGRNISEMEGKLSQAFEKHQQELKFLAEEADATCKAGFERERKRVVDFAERLNQ